MLSVFILAHWLIIRLGQSEQLNSSDLSPRHTFDPLIGLFGPMSTLKILHFNDVYRVTKQKVPGGTIDVTQFAAMLEKQRSQWQDLPNGKKNGLLLFSGDVFSPSVESSVTRGSHMVRPFEYAALYEVYLFVCFIQVPVMNALSPDVAVTGNHASIPFGLSFFVSLLVCEPPLRRISTLGILT